MKKVQYWRTEIVTAAGEIICSDWQKGKHIPEDVVDICKNMGKLHTFWLTWPHTVDSTPSKPKPMLSHYGAVYLLAMPTREVKEARITLSQFTVAKEE